MCGIFIYRHSCCIVLHMLCFVYVYSMYVTYVMLRTMQVYQLHQSSPRIIVLLCVIVQGC